MQNLSQKIVDTLAILTLPENSIRNIINAHAFKQSGSLFCIVSASLVQQLQKSYGSGAP